LEQIAARIDGLSADGVDRTESGADHGDGAVATPSSAGADSQRPAPPSPAPSLPHLAHPMMPLLASKLHPPRLPGGLIERTRLLDRLDAGLSHKLTLLSAPAGFGKTTLVRQWIAARVGLTGLPVAWVALDAGDNDPVRFWR